MTTLSRGDGWKKRRHLREDVRFAQRLVRAVSFLPCGADGAFGPGFEKTVRAFQRGRGLSEDGVVGPEVWGELSGSLVPFWDGKLEPSVLYALAGMEYRTALPWCRALDEAFEYGDISTPLRQSHFLAQVLVESGEFRYTAEISDGSQYEGREDLGNTQPGDGVRFKGRGLIQITGRQNVRAFSETIEEDVLSNPELMEELPLAATSAAWYWKYGSPIGPLNDWADRDDILGTSAGVNWPRAAHDRHLAHVVNHLPKRKSYWRRCKVVFGTD